MNAGSRSVASNITRRMASALVGRSVTIQVGSGTVEGIVTQVTTEAGSVKVIVDGLQYPIEHILTAAPSDLCKPSVVMESL